MNSLFDQYTLSTSKKEMWNDCGMNGMRTSISCPAEGAYSSFFNIQYQVNFLVGKHKIAHRLKALRNLNVIV